mgnify:CR=1 FL=1
MNLQGSKIKASRTKTAWKSAENSKKAAEKSVNLRANFDKNKKASRIKALREFTMKRLTDFFGEKDWKTGKMGYNENRKRSKHCCWTVPMRDWNMIVSVIKSPPKNVCWTVPMRDWNSLSSPKFSVESGVGWTVPMRDWNLFEEFFSHKNISFVEPYLWVSNVLYTL